MSTEATPDGSDRPPRSAADVDQHRLTTPTDERPATGQTSLRAILWKWRLVFAGLAAWVLCIVLFAVVFHLVFAGRLAIGVRFLSVVHWVVFLGLSGQPSTILPSW